jgi:predicted dehydrogenase
MGPFGGDRPLDDWLIENAVHAVDLASFVAGTLRAVRCSIWNQSGEHVVLARADSESGAAVSLQMCTTGPWWHDNELLEVFGHGTSARTENATVFRFRPWDGPEECWAPNYTIPVERNTSTFVLGFVPELRVFAALRLGDAAECDLEMAAQALEVIETIVATDV